MHFNYTRQLLTIFVGTFFLSCTKEEIQPQKQIKQNPSENTYIKISADGTWADTIQYNF